MRGHTRARGDLMLSDEQFDVCDGTSSSSRELRTNSSSLSSVDDGEEAVEEGFADELDEGPGNPEV